MPDGGYDAHEGRELRVRAPVGAARIQLPEDDERAWALVAKWVELFPELSGPKVQWHVTQGGKSWQN